MAPPQASWAACIAGGDGHEFDAVEAQTGKELGPHLEAHGEHEEVEENSGQEGRHIVFDSILRWAARLIRMPTKYTVHSPHSDQYVKAIVMNLQLQIIDHIKKAANLFFRRRGLYIPPPMTVRSIVE